MNVLYRISKYDPIYRVNGVYLKNEWTDYSDIGRTFDGEELTLEQYLLVEKRYLDAAVRIAELSGEDSFEINGLEKYENDCKYCNKQTVLLEDMEELLRQCLRNKCWCMLVSDSCGISFGYDYYLYISTSISKSSVMDTCNRYQLFVDKMEHDKTVMDLYDGDS